MCGAIYVLPQYTFIATQRHFKMSVVADVLLIGGPSKFIGVKVLLKKLNSKEIN